MEYKVAYGDTAQALETKVNELLTQGWKLQGGVTASLNNNDDQGGNVSVIFAQALIKG